MPRLFFATTLFLITASCSLAGDGNRLAYLDGPVNPYYVGLNFPKLTTPMWVGEEGVDAVVVLAIDDMTNNSEKYEQFLRPILNRLKQIDGRAPVSVMACKVKPDDQQLQAWLNEGLSIECHTLTHPCPLLQKGDFQAAADAYHGCVDLMAKIPGNTPVAFRMPCCDSKNTVSPRFFAEIFNKTSKEGRFLAIDSSVFCILTPDDPDLPRELVFDQDGRERFRKYLPFKSFVNTIENYPYPYFIGDMCWEFPCIVPSDWEAQNLQKPDNPKTVEDMKAALDAIVIKQGVMNLVFHPHNWIKSEQVVELIDHAVAKHGKKVKFLNFREALERLHRTQLDALGRVDPPVDIGARGVDIDEDGNLDLVVSNDEECYVAFYDMDTGSQSRKIFEAKPGTLEALPKIASRGQNRGFWVHSRQLLWQNEDTDQLPDHVDRRSFNDLLKNVEPRAKSPEASLKSIKMRPGYQVELVAAEPLVMDPVAFDWDEKGRLWVVEMADYPLGEDGKGKPCGRIRVLTDTDNDGRYDQSVVFLDGLSYPNGVMCWRNGILVSCAPDIFYAEDTDGDGTCDKREVLFTGFNLSNPQHRVNGFALGLDGWVYAADAESNKGVKSLKTGKTHQIRGSDIRFKPDTGELEATSGRGQFGRQRDDWGNWFSNDNSNWARHEVIDNPHLRRNPSLAIPTALQLLEPDRRLFPVSPILARFNDLDNAGFATSACSPAPYRDELFGPWFENNLFVCEPVHNLVHRVVLKPDGETYRGERAPGEEQSEFLASSDNWSRFVQVKTGPDGALWVGDMYRAVIEHPEWIPDDWEAKLDLRAGHDKGRIYRVFPVGSKPRPIVKLDGMDTKQLVQAMDSPNGPQRDTAMRLLLHKNDNSVAPELAKRARSATRPQVRLQALATLTCLDHLDDATLLAGLNDAHPEVRRFAAEHVGPLEGRAPGTGIRKALLDLAKDKSARVRFGVALGVGDADSGPPPKNVEDPELAAAVIKIKNESVVEPVLIQILWNDAEDQWLRAAALSSSAPYAAGVLQGLSTQASGASEKTGHAVEVPNVVMDSLLPLIFDDKAHLQENVSRLATLGLTRFGQDDKAWVITRLTSLLDAAARRGLSFQELTIILPPSEQGFFRERVAEIGNAARLVARDDTRPTLDRIAAIRLLGRSDLEIQDALATLASMLKANGSPELQRAAIAPLMRVDPEGGTKLLLAGWKNYSPSLRSAVLDGLLERPARLGSLISAIKSGDVWIGELPPRVRQALTEHRDLKLRTEARLLFAIPNGALVFQPGRNSRLDVLAEYEKALAKIGPGDPAEGAAVFAKTCSVCHRIKGVGTEVGADLTALTDRSTSAMLDAILDPNKAFETQFTEYSIAMKDGRVLSGLIVAETANNITLRRQEGKEDLLLRTEIDEISSAGRSFMTEGLEKDLTPKDLADLIAFLGTAGPPPKSFEGNKPTLIGPGQNGEIGLPATAAEVYGSSLVFESHYENLGHWSSADDRAAWTFDVMNDGTYDVFINYACQSDVSGNHFLIKVETQQVEGVATSTGTWDNYRRKQRVGELSLKKGRNRLEVAPVGEIRGALMDLKAVILAPRPTGN